MRFKPGASGPDLPEQRLCHEVLQDKYLKGHERSRADLFERVARGLASVEPTHLRDRYERAFRANLEAGAIGAGRIMSAAGTPLAVTLVNCFVQPVGDCPQGKDQSGYPGLREALQEARSTLRMGGGVGYDFSRIRPLKAIDWSEGSPSTGPCGAIDLFEAASLTLMGEGARRAAQMGVLRIDHPDILEFINAKRQPGRWTHFNVSVAVSDDFIAALGRGDRWPLWHRVPPREGTAYARTRHPTEDGWLYACLPATELWDALLRASFETSEPGVLFMDRIERDNNLRSIESILATNPCITGDTWVTTDHGRVKASDLVGRSFNAVVGGQTWPSGASGFVSKGIQPVLELRSSQGHRLRLTAHHRVRRLRPTPQDASEAAWTPADQLECGDLIVVEDNGVSQSDHPETTSVRSLRPGGLAPVFDVSIPGIEAFVANSLLVHNCGEQPLPAYGACDLGPLILPRFVRHPFGQGGTPEFEFDRFEASVALQVRALDNVLELTLWPLPQQRLEARSKRRIGVGFTGLADALIMMGLRYDLEPGRTMAARIARSMSHAAYRASVDLARDRGPFPLFDAATYLSEGTFASRLPEGLRAQIRKNGIRNSHVLSIAPTGSVSIALADNCASGIEPVFAWRQRRTVHGPDGRRRIRTVENHAWRRYRALGGDLRRLPEAFVRADEIDARSHIAMIASVQPFIDGSISKTVNLPRGFSFESYRRIYLDAWNAGLKGLATWRPESLRGTVIEPARDREGVKQAPAPELRIDRIRTCPT